MSIFLVTLSLTIKQSYALFFDFIIKTIANTLGLTTMLISLIPLWLLFGILLFTVLFFASSIIIQKKNIRVTLSLILTLIIIIATPMSWWLLISKLWSTIIVWGLIIITFIIGYFLLYHKGGIGAKGGEITRTTHIIRLIGLMVYFTIAEMILISVYNPLVELLLAIISLLIIYEIFAAIFHGGKAAGQEDISQGITNVAEQIEKLRGAGKKLKHALRKEEVAERKSFKELKKELNDIERGITGFDIGKDLNVLFSKIKAIIEYLKSLMKPEDFSLRDFDAGIKELNKAIQGLEETLRKYHATILSSEVSDIKNIKKEIEQYQRAVRRYFDDLRKTIKELLVEEEAKWPIRYHHKKITKQSLQKLLDELDNKMNSELKEFSVLAEDINEMFVLIQDMDAKTKDMLHQFEQLKPGHPGPLMEATAHVKAGEVDKAKITLDNLYNQIEDIQTRFIKHIEDQRKHLLSTITKMREALDEIRAINNRIKSRTLADWI